MTMTDLQQLRYAIADQLQSALDYQDGDNETVVFFLSHKHIEDDTYEVFVDGSLKTEGTDYTLDRNEGKLEFSDPPATDVSIKVKYRYSAFTDEELLEFLDTDGSVNASSIRCIKILLADSARFFDYSTGQSSMKSSQVFDHLKDLLRILQDEGSDIATDGGARIVGRTGKYEHRRPYRDNDLSRSDE